MRLFGWFRMKNPDKEDQRISQQFEMAERRSTLVVERLDRATAIEKIRLAHLEAQEKVMSRGHH